MALAYAVRPSDWKLALMRPLSLASIFAALASLTAGWAYVLQGAAATPKWTARAVQSLLMGSSQTLIPVFVTFGFLAVSWLLVTVGMRRQERALAISPDDSSAGAGSTGSPGSGGSPGSSDSGSVVRNDRPDESGA